MRVVSNDIMNLPALKARVLIANNSVMLTEEDLVVLCRPNPNGQQFVQRYYGKILGDSNCAFLDRWASNIQLLADPQKRELAAFVAANQVLKHGKFCVATFTCLKTLTGYRNFWDIDLKEETLAFACDGLSRLIFDNGQVNDAHQSDAVEFISTVSADVAYVDSPYCCGGGEYERSLSFYDDLAVILSGQGNRVVNPYDYNADLPPYTHFEQRPSAIEGFGRLFNNSRHIPRLIVSYNTTSAIKPPELIALAEAAGWQVTSQEHDSRRPTTKPGGDSHTKEVLLVCDRRGS